MFKKFDTMFVGIRKDISFMTPDGEDKASSNRKNTIKNWCGKNGICRSIPNDPTTGFKIISGGTGYNSNQKTVKVEDPRGFILEVSVENAVHLLMNCEVKNGVISEELVWVKSGNNHLLRSDSKEYANAVPFHPKERKKIQVKISDVKFGDVLLDKKGREWVYYGKVKETYHVEVSYATMVSFGHSLTKGQQNVFDGAVENKPFDIFIARDKQDNIYSDFSEVCNFYSVKENIAETIDTQEFAKVKSLIEKYCSSNRAFSGESYNIKYKLESMIRNDGYRPTSSRSLDKVEVYKPRKK